MERCIIYVHILQVIKEKIRNMSYVFIFNFMLCKDQHPLETNLSISFLVSPRVIVYFQAGPSCSNSNMLLANKILNFQTYYKRKICHLFFFFFFAKKNVRSFGSAKALIFFWQKVLAYLILSTCIQYSINIRRLHKSLTIVKHLIPGVSIFRSLIKMMFWLILITVYVCR